MTGKQLKMLFCSRKQSSKPDQLDSEGSHQILNHSYLFIDAKRFPKGLPKSQRLVYDVLTCIHLALATVMRSFLAQNHHGVTNRNIVISR